LLAPAVPPLRAAPPSRSLYIAWASRSPVFSLYVPDCPFVLIAIWSPFPPPPPLAARIAELPALCFFSRLCESPPLPHPSPFFSAGVARGPLFFFFRPVDSLASACTLLAGVPLGLFSLSSPRGLSPFSDYGPTLVPLPGSPPPGDFLSGTADLFNRDNSRHRPNPRSLCSPPEAGPPQGDNSLL